MVRGRHAVGPQTEANHVGLGNLAQRAVAAQEHVATGHKGVDVLGRALHDFLVERQLEVQQILSDVLTACPAKHGNRCQHLAAGGVGRQAAALSASVEEDALLLGQPFGIGDLGGFGLVATMEQPRGATARTEFAVGGVGRSIIGSGLVVGDCVEGACRIGRQG